MPPRPPTHPPTHPPHTPPHTQVPWGFNEYNDTEAMVQVHLNAMESQLTDMYYAFALAHLLNRTLIMPRVGLGWRLAGQGAGWGVRPVPHAHHA